MDPINNNNRINRLRGQQPQGPNNAGKADQSGKPFEVGGGASQPGPGEAAPTGGPGFSGIRERIRDGLDRSLPREQILHNVVTEEAKRVLGADVPAETIDHITRTFEQDPGLTRLFDKLMAQAERQ